MTKYSGLPVETTLSVSDFLLKIKAAGAGDVLVSWQNFFNTFPFGFVLPLQTGLNINPLDATTYYFGTGASLSNGATTTNITAHQFVPHTGHITAAYGTVIVGGTLGSSETGTMSIRVNDTTDFTVNAAQAFTAAQNTFGNSGLNIPVTAGDYITGKIACPTWVTNPTAVYFLMNVFISA